MKKISLTVLSDLSPFRGNLYIVHTESCVRLIRDPRGWHGNILGRRWINSRMNPPTVLHAARVHTDGGEGIRSKRMEGEG